MACAVRSSLSPLRLPDPEGVEMLLIRLQGAAVTIALCYRPPDDDDDLQRMADALAGATSSHGRLIVICDFNLPEITWTASNGGARPLDSQSDPTGRSAFLMTAMDWGSNSGYLSPLEVKVCSTWCSLVNYRRECM